MSVQDVCFPCAKTVHDAGNTAVIDCLPAKILILMDEIAMVAILERERIDGVSRA
jgi:hypothetical protein